MTPTVLAKRLSSGAFAHAGTRRPAMSHEATIDKAAVEDVETILRPVPDSGRESTAMHQFWIWAGANLALINWFLGSLGILIGVSFAETVLVLVLSNVI